MASRNSMTLKRIERQRFDEMLNMLPPVSWIGIGSHAESFRMSECDDGDIATFYCRIGADHFELKAGILSSHDAIVERCRTFLQFGYAAAVPTEAGA